MMKQNSAHTTPPGGYLLADTPVTFNKNRPVTHLNVRNTGDRPVQIGSHFHFFEVNKALHFDRPAAFGKRLNIAAATSIRFEPGDEIAVALIPFAGKKTLNGFNNLVDGRAVEITADGTESVEKQQAIKRARERGFITTGD